MKVFWYWGDKQVIDGAEVQHFGLVIATTNGRFFVGIVRGK